MDYFGELSTFVTAADDRIRAQMLDEALQVVYRCRLEPVCRRATRTRSEESLAILAGSRKRQIWAIGDEVRIALDDECDDRR
ncbi:MAG: hypothetical protein Q7S58_10520 [Candidatus Binatus sp.]|uniref:hypothetical protein n=1 Tax=Candidatus Binatus sp. TaxID=2811406 RepID=UPI00271DC72B|nr:hypothetical protein [Candidatus Binatus sp.]MDO8432827.1 hypothetical protein [Candidatus Binatus sp.]